MSLCSMTSIILNTKQTGRVIASFWRQFQPKLFNMVNQGSRRTYKKGTKRGAFGVNDTFYHPSDFEKKILVFTRIYPSMNSIPKTVSQNAILRAKDRMRVVTAFGMIGLTVIGFLLVVRYSRKVRDEGDGIMKRTFELQKKLAAERQSQEDATRTD